MASGSNYPPVVVVDENDNEIGSAMLAEVWQKGFYHRIVSIFVTDGQGRMLLQLRGAQVKIYPNCWDQAAGGHVDEGFSYDQAAANELAEELGVHNVPLKQLGTFRSNDKLDDGRIINQFERVYLAELSDGTELKLQADEVSKVQWFTAAELKALISQHPERFTSGLLYCLREYFPAFGV
jgi:isopentenyl-diphosphate Delta-isomerase